MVLDNTTKEKILNDYKLAQGRINSVLSGLPNFRVINNDYLTPTIIMDTNLSLDDLSGELKYFSAIRSTLESALTTGSIPPEMFLPQMTTPDYITQLYQKN